MAARVSDAATGWGSWTARVAPYGSVRGRHFAAAAREEQILSSLGARSWLGARHSVALMGFVFGKRRGAECLP
jgi:hypothetical protein